MRTTFRLVDIPTGPRGSLATLRLMQGLVTQALWTPQLVQAVRARVCPRTGSDGAAVEALREWCRRHWRFRDDPADMELLRTPAYFLARWERSATLEGDCDDAAVWTAFCGGALGCGWGFRALAFAPGGFDHVYTRLWTRDGWVHNMDVTNLGMHPVPEAVQILDV